MSDVYEFMQKKGTAHRVAPLRTRDFRAQPFSGDTVCKSTGIHDMGAPMYEWKEELDGLGRSYPVCTTVLSSDKTKVYTDADKKALDEKVAVERQAGRTTGKEAERLRAALTYHAKQQRHRNDEAAQALTLIQATVTGDLWARVKPFITSNKQHTEAALDAILGFIFDTFAGQPTDIRDAVIAKFDEIGYAETAAELSLV